MKYSELHPEPIIDPYYNRDKVVDLKGTGVDRRLGELIAALEAMWALCTTPLHW